LQASLPPVRGDAARLRLASLDKQVRYSWEVSTLDRVLRPYATSWRCKRSTHLDDSRSPDGVNLWRLIKRLP
jgi:hypothetical protein